MDGELGSILSCRKDIKAKESREGEEEEEEDRGIYMCKVHVGTYRTLRYAMNV